MFHKTNANETLFMSYGDLPTKLGKWLGPKYEKS